MNVRKVVLASAVSGILGFGSIVSAQVTGKVTVKGEIPEPEMLDLSGVKECAAKHTDPVADPGIMVGEKNELQNVVVTINRESHPDVTGPVPAEPAVLDQVGCMYEPHVMGLMTGQKLMIKNSDAFLHNVHFLTQQNPPLNKGQANIDPGMNVEPLKVAEQFRVKCDVHPWMSAYLHVFDHPFFGVSKEDGMFSIAGLPDGEYTLKAWHEKFGEKEGTVKVAGGKGTVNFEFDAAAAALAPVVPDVKLMSMLADPGTASTVAKAVAADDCGCEDEVKK